MIGKWADQFPYCSPSAHCVFQALKAEEGVVCRLMGGWWDGEDSGIYTGRAEKVEQNLNCFLKFNLFLAVLGLRCGQWDGEDSGIYAGRAEKVEQNLNCFLKVNLFLAVLGLRCCSRAFSSCRERGLLFIAVRGLLTVVASLFAEHRL